MSLATAGPRPVLEALDYLLTKQRTPAASKESREARRVPHFFWGSCQSLWKGE